MANSYKLKYRSGSSYVTYCPFPVNSIFMSWSTVNPSTYWPGTTWTQISAGRYLVASGSGYTVGSSYGANTVTLTVNQMPSHNHKILLTGQGSSGSGCEFVGANADGGLFDGGYIGDSGGGQAHENRPLSYAVSMWRRTA